MKVCLIAHGYPPELVGGTEKSVQELARGLVRRGLEVVVVAGSLDHARGFRTSEATDEADGRTIRVRRIHRADLYFDHWQKSASARVAETFRAILREERPDLVHVHHWIRLSRDLVRCAAVEGVPAVVTLHDLWTSCLITFRVRPDTKEFCEATLAPDPCLDCAAQIPPRTPWVARENQHLALAERRADLVRELELARAVCVPSRAHARVLERFLALDPEALALRVIPHGRDLALVPRAPLPPPKQHGRLVLGSWGHLHPVKGTELIVGAVRRLADLRGPERVELCLAGEEADADFGARLDAAAAGLNVTRHGRFNADELDRHPVSAVHAMVSGTRAHESWGLVVDEAVALRLPLVLPRSGAYAERLTDGAGALLYAPGGEAELTEVLRRLLDEPGLCERLRERLPPLAELVPTVAQHVEAMLAVYEDVLRAGAPAPPAEEWWRARMQLEAERAWDASLARSSPEELGLP